MKIIFINLLTDVEMSPVPLSTYFWPDTESDIQLDTRDKKSDAQVVP